MIDWNIQARAHTCHQCGKAFADQEVYHTLLLDEKTAYARQDLCAACWDHAAKDQTGRRSGFVSHWQGVFEVPPPRTELIRRETAEGLLRKLVERNDPGHLAALFILAVMLERKRQLKVKDQLHRDGRRYFVYEQPKTGDVFTIADPALNLDQLEEVQRDVAHLLEHGLETEEGSVPAVPAAESTGETEAPLSPPTAAPS